MTKLLLLLLVVLTVGCAPSETHFWVVGDATDQEITTMQSAADEWCEATSGAWCATIDRTEGSNLIAIVPREVLGTKQGLHTLHNNVVERWHEVQIAEYRERETWETDLYLTTMHELGHVFGILGHYEGTLMQRGYDRDTFPELFEKESR